MIETITTLLSDPQNGPVGILLGLLLLMIYLSRRDNCEHREDFKTINTALLETVKENTSAKTDLANAIKELRQDLRDKR